MAYRVGGLAAARFGWADENPYLTTITGVLLLMLPVVLARLVSLGGGIMFPAMRALPPTTPGVDSMCRFRPSSTGHLLGTKLSSRACAARPAT